MNKLYNVWNFDYINQTNYQQYHNQQIKQGLDCIKKLNDLMDAMDKVDPAYQEFVFCGMCAVIAERTKK